MKYVQEEKDKIIFLLPYYKQNTNTIQRERRPTRYATLPCGTLKVSVFTKKNVSDKWDIRRFSYQKGFE